MQADRPEVKLLAVARRYEFVAPDIGGHPHIFFLLADQGPELPAVEVIISSAQVEEGENIVPGGDILFTGF